MRPHAADFQNAVAAFQRSDFTQAKKLGERLLKKKQHVADVCHLLALVHKSEGDFTKARQYFERSLAADSRQAAVCANYANLLVQGGHTDAANDMYARATRANSALLDAWFNWASLLIELNRHEAALEKIDTALSLNPGDARLHIVRGIALRGMESFDESGAAFDQAIQIATLESALGITAAQNKAITLRVQNRPAQAATCLSELIDRKISNADVYFIKACAHYDADEFDKAEADLCSAIELQPDYVDAHEALNKLYWERGDDERFLVSYQQCISKTPLAKNLRYAYAAQAIMADQKDLAKAVLQQAIAELGADANLVHALGVLELGDGAVEKAATLFDQAISQQPNAARYRIDKANILIRHEDYAGALQELDHAGRHSPLDQEIWAYRGLCWRLCGDPRADWLNDYDQLIDARLLDVPAGYDNLEHFLQVLRSDLEKLHKTQRQPLDQSVRNGTQTVGTLLSLPIKSVQDYKSVLSKSIQDYIDALPADAEHPFLNRNTRRFVHSGSWSVKLARGGFHTNHMHPQGWLSNCTYIAVPLEVRADDATRAGWIRFGQTSLELGEREAVGKAICPQEGLRVLFPSFLWHGTYAFDSDQPRITAPSDIMPKA
ncbi:MAG: tetratricopeptide repeat protein [Woeseia sp.]